MITYKILYWIVCLILFFYYQTQNSFDDESIVGKISLFLNKITGKSIIKDGFNYSTFTSRFRVSVILYLLSWVIWFIIW